MMCLSVVRKFRYVHVFMWPTAMKQYKVYAIMLSLSMLYLCYKIEFSISGNPLLVNMGTQWHIYFFKRIQCSFTYTFVKHVHICEQ